MIRSLSLILIASWVSESSSVTFLATGGLGSAAASAASTLAGAFPTAGAGTAAAGAATAAGTAAAGTAAAGTAAAGASAVTPAALGPLGIALGPGSIWAYLANPLVVPGKMVAVSAAGIGAVVVGADMNESAVTWDCWKPILHEKSMALSNGRLLTDILNDPVISDYSIGPDAVFVRNRWNESWRIDPLVLPWGQVAAHASQV